MFARHTNSLLAGLSILGMLLIAPLSATAVPSLSPLYNVTLNLAPQIPAVPLVWGRGQGDGEDESQNEGRVQAAWSIVNGTVTGALSGVIQGGLATPVVYGSGGDTTEFSAITFYGVADDGAGFVGREEGFAVAGAQLTRVVLTAGGEAANLSTAFIVCETQERTQEIVRVECFQLVPGVSGAPAWS